MATSPTTASSSSPTTGARHDYALGDAFGHVAIGVDDIHAVCERLRAGGVRVTREPGPMQHGRTVIAFVEDPNGYKIELIER